jgi:Aminotransferase class I and II
MNYGRRRGGVMPLWAGEGDLAAPPFIAEAATRALAAGETFYTWQRGIPELREALARYHSRLYGREFSSDEFFVTGSGMQAIQIALAMTAGVGDEVLIPTPTWPNAAAAAGVIGARPVEVPMSLGNAGWSLDLDRLEGAAGPRTRALFLVSPSHPTGWTATREALNALLALARRRGLWIIADEAYCRFWYGEGERAPSFIDEMAYAASACRSRWKDTRPSLRSRARRSRSRRAIRSDGDRGQSAAPRSAPNPAMDRLEAEPMLIRGPHLDSFSGCLATSSATVSASFFISCFLRGACSLRVAGTRRLDRPANRLECFPSALHANFGQAEFTRHPMCDLAARPQTAVRRRLLKPNLQLSQKLRLENRRPRTVVATKITQRDQSRCSGQIAPRSSAAQSTSSPPFPRSYGPAPAARSSDNVVPSRHSCAIAQAVPASSHTCRTYAIAFVPALKRKSKTTGFARINLARVK